VDAGRSLKVAALIALLSCAPGCLSEQSFKVDARRVVLVDVSDVSAGANEVRSTRRWLQRVHGQLASLLPPGDPPALLTEDLTDSRGEPVDVFAHFGLAGDKKHTIWHNFDGLVHTVQGRGASYAIDEPAPLWPGFEDLWIPVGPQLELSARLGLARNADGSPRVADCVVVMSGLNGDNSVTRTRDIAMALRESGLHALALELRGHGQTEARYPTTYFTFGVLEAGDLAAVSDWLEARPEVHRTGMIGYCWGANIAMLTAWENDRSGEHPNVPDRLAAHLRPHDGRRRYRAGIMAFSPTLTFEEIIENLKRPWAFLSNPPLNVLQDTVRDRMAFKRHPEVCGDLLKLIEFEFAKSEVSYSGSVDDALGFLRLLPFRDLEAGDKLEDVLVPLLIVHGADDPLATSQAVATLLASVENPRVAGLVLPGGGHVGFAPYARDYFYSLLLNFFDPVRGPAAEPRK